MQAISAHNIVNTVQKGLIFSTMPIVERELLARWSRHRHRDLTLAWINALLAGQTDAAIDL